MASIFDSDPFNQRLFFPRADFRPPPPGAEEVLVEVPGARLHLRWHRSPGARATLLLFHGNGEVVTEYDEAAERFAAVGLELAVVDFRGYGASTGTPTLRAAIDDAPRVLEELLALGPKPVVVMGRSLGSACAAQIYGSPAPAGLKGVVLESGFVDLEAAIRRRGLQPPERFAEDELAEFDPLPKLARGRLPLLVLHGAEDRSISPAEGREAHDAAGGAPKTLVFVEGRGHNDISDSRAYWESLDRFVRAVVPQE